MGADDMKARTPAPEGEVVAWRWRRIFESGKTTAWLVEDYLPSHAKPPHYEVQPLYASPAPEGEAVAALRARYEKVKATPYSPGTPAERMKEGELHGLNTALAIVMALDDRLASPVVPVGVSEAAQRLLDYVDARKATFNRDDMRAVADAILKATDTGRE
jgi:hypothetical protein